MQCNKNLKARNALLKSTNIRIWESRKIFKILVLIKQTEKIYNKSTLKFTKIQMFWNKGFGSKVVKNNFMLFASFCISFCIYISFYRGFLLLFLHLNPPSTSRGFLVFSRGIKRDSGFLMITNIKSSRQTCSVKDVLRNFAKSTGKNLY